MMNKKVYQWISEQETRKTVLKAFNQPLISRQVSKTTGIPANTCSYVIANFVDKGLLVCLNSKSHSSRLYWLTEEGHPYRKKLYRDQNLLYKESVLPNIDWTIYGLIKLILRLKRSHIRISANNIRDIVRFFSSKGIVRPVKILKKAHLRYELTDLGIKLQHLLIQADATV